MANIHHNWAVVPGVKNGQVLFCSQRKFQLGWVRGRGKGGHRKGKKITPPRNLGYIWLPSKTLDWFLATDLAWSSFMNITDWVTEWLPSRVNGTTKYRRNSVLLRFHTTTMKKAPRTKGRGLGHSKLGRHGWRWLPDGRWMRSLNGVFTLRSHRWGTKPNCRQRYLLGTILPCMTIFF